jgi:hypothetical protein
MSYTALAVSLESSANRGVCERTHCRSPTVLHDPSPLSLQLSIVMAIG